MSTVKQTDAGLAPLANAYLLAGLGAIAVIGVALMQTTGRWALVPTLVGAAGLAFRWRSGSLLVLAGIAIGQVGRSYYLHAGFGLRTSLAADLGLCAATLAYVIAQYRLVGLTAGVFPPVRRKLDQPPPRPGSASTAELAAAGLSVAACSVGAFFLWEVVGEVPAPWHMYPTTWRLGMVAWVLLGGLALAAAVLGHLGWRRLSPAEAAVFLQDALWHETRREQRRINRWRAWAVRRLRRN
jgi:hypothetical protein